MKSCFPHVLLFASGLLAWGPSASAQDRQGLAELTVKDFAAKYLMQQADLADLRMYAAANAEIVASADKRSRVVLLGDSITFHWEEPERPAPGGVNVINRGIAGQNSDQMLLRFEDDVVALKPAAVVIAAGANDARVFVGPPAAARAQVIARIARNLTAMADIADSHRIKVVVASITPCRGCDALSRDPETIRAANEWLRGFATLRGYQFVDYHAALAGPDGQLAADLTSDGLHPLAQGYARMWRQLEPAIGRLKLTR